MKSTSETSPDKVQLSENDIRNWLIAALAEKLEIESSKLQTDIPFDEYGLDSVAAVSISGALGDLLNQDLPGTLLYEYPTVDELSLHLSETLS